MAGSRRHARRARDHHLRHRAGWLPPRSDIAIAIAATQFESADEYRVGGHLFDTAEAIDEFGRLCGEFPITSSEDPASEDDPAGMALAVRQLGAVAVGDDFLVTDSSRLARAAVDGQIGAALIKVNQAGTFTPASDTAKAARAGGTAMIVSARSGETEDVSVSHLATVWCADAVKVGSITRGERTRSGTSCPASMRNSAGFHSHRPPVRELRQSTAQPFDPAT
ncbi:phosphopyruvate hydratase family protein [Rathayibacter soli]|uniref:hypothetical protein n=1 Tax=Rathayibacter soli TaxID=3144168 RepID=UPI0027E46402|nr:hypothetical protein [Glaciibacter superstes]